MRSPLCVKGASKRVHLQKNHPSQEAKCSSPTPSLVQCPTPPPPRKPPAAGGGTPKAHRNLGDKGRVASEASVLGPRVPLQPVLGSAGAGAPSAIAQAIGGLAAGATAGVAASSSAPGSPKDKRSHSLTGSPAGSTRGSRSKR